MPRVSVDDIERAEARIRAVAHRTPLDRSVTFANWSGAASVGLKLENMQRTGSFKIRGAYNRMAQLPQGARDRGVIASSAGNHAQGVALAGQLLDIDVTIVVPAVTPAAKIAATRGYGADVIVEGEIYERAYEHALDLAESEGYEFVHPFDDEEIIAGQGTVGLELIEQYPELDVVLVPIGGGGLISGIATALESLDRDVRVIGVQPTGAAHAKPSLEQDRIVELPDVDTVADGIADTRLLETTFESMRERVDEVLEVTDDDLAKAVTVLAERAKTVVEAAGAASVAGLLSTEIDLVGDHVAAVISGGNVDLADHADLVRGGLIALDRFVVARLAIDGWPAAIDQLNGTLTEHGAQLRELRRPEGRPADPPNRVPLEVGLDGSGRDHLEAVLRAIDGQPDVAVLEDTLTGDST